MFVTWHITEGPGTSSARAGGNGQRRRPDGAELDLSSEIASRLAVWDDCRNYLVHAA